MGGLADAESEAFFERVGQYYEEPATLCWEIAARGHLHSGYWDEANSHAEPWVGPLRLTEWLIEKTPILPEQRFIDFGSGFGAPAILLAQRKGCLVDGVNASRYQVAKAITAAEEAGLADRVRFRVEDARAVNVADGSYDGGWFLESIFHMGHAKALQEARRVLKKGATLLITDFINHERTSQEFLELQRDILLAEHGSLTAYPGLLADAGFEVVEMMDLTEEVILRGDARNQTAFNIHEDEMLAVAGEDYLPFVRQVSDLFAQNAGYVFIQARAA